MKKILKKIVFVEILLIMAACIYAIVDLKDNEISYTINDDNSVTVSMTDKRCQIALSDKNEANENTVFEQYEKDVTYKLNSGNNFILVKDAKGDITALEANETVILEVENDFLPFYPVDDMVDLNYEYISFGDGTPIIVSSDENIIRIEDNKLITVGPGKAMITVNSNSMSDSVEVEVTDLYTKPNSDSDTKPFLNKLLIDNPEEAAKLDEILRLKIEEAGFGTRAGVVAAARFLALEFPYKLTYFSEGGRLDPDSSKKSDGEGRYYHYGLFLSEDKFDNLGPSIFGRATWGEYFREDTSDNHELDEFYLYDGFVPADIGSQLYLSKRPNGLDCSGHVSWCYYNGGFDFGDIGAGGPGSTGMNELGEFVWISDELLQSDRIKCGDLVGFVGHIGIVIGVEEDYIWITDNLVSGLKVKRYERNKESFDELGHNAWKYFMLMDDEYLEDGNYTAMWEE